MGWLCGLLVLSSTDVVGASSVATSPSQAPRTAFSECQSLGLAYPLQWSTWDQAEGPDSRYDEQAIFFDAVAHALATALPNAE